MSAALSHKGRRTSKPRRCGTTPAKTTRTPACIQQDTALKQKPEGFYFSASTPPRPKRLNCQKCTEEQRFLLEACSAPTLNKGLLAASHPRLKIPATGANTPNANLPSAQKPKLYCSPPPLAQMCSTGFGRVHGVHYRDSTAANAPAKILF